jgi:hypothetical protein
VWNAKEKFLAVSVLKFSPISYAFLWFLFTVPSIKNIIFPSKHCPI